METTRREILGMAAGLMAAKPRRRWQGTFLQLWAAHKEWPDDRWTELFGYLRALGMGEVVVQWSRYDGIDYRSEVRRIIAAGFDVWMGLGYDSDWWRNPSPAKVRGAVGGVEPAAGVRGFYLPQELEDGQWMERQRFADLAGAITELRRQFHPLAVSGFTNRTGSPDSVARFWSELQRKSRFDRLLFQDGIGSGKMPLGEWARWAKPLAKGMGRRLTFVVETFSAQGEGATWRAMPAEWQRIEEQLRVAAESSRNAPIAFSAPEYMTPLGGASAAQLFDHFLPDRADTHH